MKCSKCNYTRLPSDNAPDWQCPSCKVVYINAGSDNTATSPVELQVRNQHERVPAMLTQAAIEELELYEKQSLAARGQKIVIYSILLNLLLRAMQQAHALPDLVIEALFLCLAAYSVIGTLKICSGLGKNQNQKIMFMTFSFLPLINLITLVYLSIKTTRMLRDAGWTVGLLGAK